MRSGQKGISSFGAVIVILTLAMMGMTAVYQTMVSESAKITQWSGNQSFYIAQAGAEYAMKKFYEGVNPSVGEPGMSFANGTFIITYNNPQVVVEGRIGNAKHTIRFDRPTEAQCTAFNTSTATLDGSNKIHHIYFNKACLPTTTVDKIRLSWTPDNGQKCQKIRIDNTYVYNDPQGLPSGSLIELTNYTLNDAAQHDISKIEFDSNIQGATFTLTVYMSDQSNTGPMTFTPP